MTNKSAPHPSQRTAVSGAPGPLCSITFGAFLLELHLLPVGLQLLVSEPVEGVGALLVDDDPRLVLLLYDGFGRSHQLPLQTERRHGKNKEHQTGGQSMSV